MQYKLEKDLYIHGGIQKDTYDINEVENCLCYLCNSDDYNIIHKERGNLRIVKCNNCNLIYTNPRVKSANTNYFGDINIYYDEARLIFKNIKKHHRDRNYEFELKEIKKFKSQGSLLDIGTNMGFFLRKAREFGYKVQGIEPSPTLSKIATDNFNLDVKNNYFEEVNIAPASYDIITMIDVFEHVTNPNALLSKAYQVLKDDGILCIKVPNGNYNFLKLKLAKLLNKESQHDLFNSYEHVIHYTPNTMKVILAKNGFRIKKLCIPLPIHPPVWANLVGHYYQYPSPFILDWKRITLRNLFYFIGEIENFCGLESHFAPDLMFIIEKSKI